MPINLSMPEPTELKPRITVIGVGGAGGNAVNNMINAKLEGVEFVVANTDAQALAQTLTERRIQLGTNVTYGLGAGANPEVGRDAALEALDEIMDHLEGSHMAFITAGMGGGTGTGAATVMAQAAREAGILAVGVVTKPFHFEGGRRMAMAEAGIEELKRYVDTLIVIPNQNLFRVANEKTTYAEAFEMADNVLYSGVRGVTDLMIMPGLINLDFADVRAVMGEMGKAMMGTGEAEGEKRALEAAEAAISNPLLDDVSMQGATGVLINITGGMDMTLFEVDEAANRVRDEVHAEANIIFGSTFDQTLEGTMRVSIVATGIDSETKRQPVTSPSLRLQVVGGGQAETGTDAGAEAELDEIEAGAGPPQVRQLAEARTPAVALRSTAPIGPVPAPASVTTPPPASAPEVPPVTAEAASEPAVQAKDESEPKEPATAARESFIPPPPVEPLLKRQPLRAPEPFATAALDNASKQSKKHQRGPSLLERMTGTGRARQAAEEAKQPKPATPAAVAAPAAQTAPAASRVPEERPQPAPTPVKPLDVTPAASPSLPATGTLSPAPSDDDLLDIPAFLRRQAN
ncbi:MAG: cell division protein FtsZ [Alphaproteobacteria bacterium]|jgi:cell division protein FtsZ|nr:cell division protein FtsZ [Alphaproteobacteria bacterium]HJP20416.1 cell division protein FtsZ [Alphaproteobacteria bacterium]